MDYGLAKQVNIRRGMAIDTLYEVTIDLSKCLGLHGMVNNQGPVDACFQEHITHPKHGRFLKFVHI